MDVKTRCDMLIDENNDPFCDPPVMHLENKADVITNRKQKIIQSKLDV